MSDWTPQDNNNLNKYLHTVRRIEEHREEKAVKEIKRKYRDIIKTTRNIIAQYYAQYADPETGALSYTQLHAASLDARLLEEIAARMNITTAEEANIIRKLVEDTYEASWKGMVDVVTKSTTDEDLRNQLSGIDSVKPETVKAAVDNPVHGLKLSDQLEQHRNEIIYDIKKAVGVGLSVGDRYDTMAKRVQTTLAGPNGTGGSYSKAIRIARTEAHRVREEGNLDAAQNVNSKLESAGLTMVKTWVTMKDERVRPNSVRKTKHGFRYSTRGKYNHVKMDGVSVPINEDFHLPSGATGPAPGQTGVAGEDINCRCFLKYEVKQDFANWARKNNGTLEANGMAMDEKKITKYMLDENGKHSADFFEAGYNKDDGTLLFNDIASQFNLNNATELKNDKYGRRFNIYMTLGKTHKLSFRTNWIQKDGEDVPRFVSAYRRRPPQ